MPTPLLTVASWNIRQGIDHDGGPIDVCRHTASIDADVLILQEGWWAGTDRSIATDVAAAGGYDLHEVLTQPGPGQPSNPRRVALLSRPPIAARGHTHLPASGSRDRRPLAWIEVEGLRIGGTHLHGIHMAKSNPLAWRRELQALAEAAAQLDVVAGDLNMWSPPIGWALRSHRPAVTGRTWPATRAHSQIDHIMYRAPLVVTAGEVLPDMDSDHRPIRTVFQLPGRN